MPTVFSEAEVVTTLCTIQVATSRCFMARWLLYYWGVCLELLGMAFMGAVLLVFFGHVDSRLLLSLTAVGMMLFYSGWFCVRYASRKPTEDPQKRGKEDAGGARA